MCQAADLGGDSLSTNSSSVVNLRYPPAVDDDDASWAGPSPQPLSTSALRRFPRPGPREGEPQVLEDGLVEDRSKTATTRRVSRPLPLAVATWLDKHLLGAEVEDVIVEEEVA
jgi:hypothetical protein